ncbi:MAG: hypothetical protein ACTSRE_02300 [Promethearchaeota archaeon]
MPYCNKCGAFIPETDEFAGICENCSDVSRSPHLISRRGPIGRRTFPVRVRRYSIRDSGITFAIIMALIFFGVILLGGF